MFPWFHSEIQNSSQSTSSVVQKPRNHYLQVFVQLLLCIQPVSLSTEINSRISCCQALDLKVLSAARHIFSHDDTERSWPSRVWTCIHPSNPLQNSSCLLSDPVNIVTCHVKPRYNAWHLHRLSRCFHVRGRLAQLDLTGSVFISLIQQVGHSGREFLTLNSTYKP